MNDIESNVIDGAVTAAQTAVEATNDLSMFALFLQASFVVKLVILALLLASVWSWAIIFTKWAWLRRLNKNANKFEDSFWNAGSIENLYDRINKKAADPIIAVFIAGMHEWKGANIKAKSLQFSASLKDRINRIMHVALGREMEEVERHVGFLASVASTAPFVGLFGTVWGIMNVMSNMSNIANVASGIAEALFATALGLVVTIPASIAYNKIALEIGRYRDRLEDFIEEFEAILSRAIENSEEQNKDI